MVVYFKWTSKLLQLYQMIMLLTDHLDEMKEISDGTIELREESWFWTVRQKVNKAEFIFLLTI